MKRVLITGSSSFVGKSVCQHLAKHPNDYLVNSISVRNSEWENTDFSVYDTIFHVAGLAHSDVGHVSEETKLKYYAVNTDLTINLAQKAKAEGVKQFIFMSSAIVYGDSAPIGKEKVIDRNSPCNAANFYGDSKVQAELGLLDLQAENFKIVILRCPMIYGKGCKGNYLTLRKLALKTPIFPKVDNRRSMLYVENLAEFVRLMIKNEEQGVFWPCNKELSNTSELVKIIAACHGKSVALVPGFQWALKGISHFTGYVNKAFGSLTYKDGLGDYNENYRLYGLEESIKETEN